MRKKPVVLVLVGLLAIGGGMGLYWFQPWKLFTNTTADETLPSTAPVPPRAADGQGSPAPAAAETALLKRGDFITHEHQTSGRVRIVRLADGTRNLEILDLDTSDGPDLRIWLTDRDVKPGSAGWRVFDDGKWVELGKLRANQGNLVYPIPAELDIAEYRSVSIWCRRFGVSFGAAQLA